MRLDTALVARGLAPSRTKAQQLIAAGRVRVDGATVRKASYETTPEQTLHADDDGWVSRAAHKLLGAITASGVDVTGRALDAGASTGGFTQVLLAHGCSHVFAVDVGHGQLHPSLVQDSRVTVREGLNLRDLSLATVGGEPVDTLVADVSFISLRLILAPMFAVLRRDGVAFLLIKPQFEVGRAALGKGGVVRDRALRETAVAAVMAGADEQGWRPVWLGESGLPGQDGNTEYVAVLRHAGRSEIHTPQL